MFVQIINVILVKYLIGVLYEHALVLLRGVALQKGDLFDLAHRVILRPLVY